MKLKVYEHLREERKWVVNEIKRNKNETSEQEFTVSFMAAKWEITTNRRRARGITLAAASEQLKNLGAFEEIESMLQDDDFSFKLKSQNIIVKEEAENLIYLSNHEDDVQNENTH